MLKLCGGFLVSLVPRHPRLFSSSLQGNAVVISAYASGMVLSKLQLSPTVNQGQPIRFLISAPTMRVPSNVAKTTNAYLAFRAVLRAGM